MMQGWERPPVVVGADGSLAARRAVRFAAEEAALRGAPLRIVTATPWPELRERRNLVDERAERRVLADADAALAEAADLAEEILPRRSITAVTAVGWPAAALIEESGQADLVVLGNRGLGGFTSLLAGSVGIEVTGHAQCPVVVVRDLPPHGSGRVPVVVGVDDGRSSRDALGAAFYEAALHGAPLVAIQVRHGREDASNLAEAVAPYREKHPDVAVVEEVREGHPPEVLLAAAVGARLLVVGTRGRGELKGLLLGSVSQAAIHHAECPVLVVRASPPAYDED
jgi:nucleotide-binding universal stress UspA family protein